MTTGHSIWRRLAAATGKGLLVLARQLFAGLRALTRFLALRVMPASWRWLRGSAFPALQRFYGWLPHRRKVVAGALLAVSATGALLWLQPSWLAPLRDGGPPQAEPVEVSRQQARWVDRILSDDWQAQKDGTRAVLESIGATVLETGAAVPAEPGFFVRQEELLILAMDGARKATTSRLSLAEYGFMLQDFGFPFAEDRVASLAMQEAVRDWVGKALDDASTPGAQAARFLHAMAARQQPAIDLASSGWSAEQYRMTHLELFVLTAALLQDTPRQPTPARRIAFDPLDLLVPKAYASGAAGDSCAIAKDANERSGAVQPGEKTMEAVVGYLLDLAIDAGNAADARVAAKRMAAVAKAAKALNLVAKLQKLMMLYSSLEVRVVADKPSVHKPSREEPGREVVFTATVEIDEEKYREYKRASEQSPHYRTLKACLKSLGLPAPSNEDDLVKDMENWEVSWDLWGGSHAKGGAHASWSTEKNAFESRNLRRKRLEMQGETRGTSRFIIDIHREDTPHEGEVTSRYVRGTATLHTDTMPGTEAAQSYEDAAKTLMAGDVRTGALALIANTIGLVGSLATELAANWAQRLLDPEVDAPVEIVFHQPGHAGYGYEGTVQATTSRQHSSSRTTQHRSRRATATMTHTEKRQGQASLQASSIRPTRMRYTRFQERRDTAVWEMEGQATVSGSLAVSSINSGEELCIAGIKATKVERNFGVRSNGSSSEAIDYAMRIEQTGSREQGYRMQVYLTGAGITFETASTHHSIKGEGCEFAGGHEHTKTETGSASMGFPGLVEDYAIDAPFPKTISGTRSVKNGDGSTTQWRWNFRRTGPFRQEPAANRTGR